MLFIKSIFQHLGHVKWLYGSCWQLVVYVVSMFVLDLFFISYLYPKSQLVNALPYILLLLRFSSQLVRIILDGGKSFSAVLVLYMRVFFYSSFFLLAVNTQIV